VKEIWVIEDEILVHGKCIKQFVLIVEKSVKYHSNLQKEDQFIVRPVGRNIDLQEENLGDISKI
jgi:hypothetical protein